MKPAETNAKIQEFNVEKDKEELIKKIAIQINTEENQMQNIAISMVVNWNFQDTLIICNTA